MIASNDIFSQLFIFLCFVNFVTAIVSTFGNLLVLITIWRTPSLHSPSFVLLSGLALSDLAVGLVAQPIFVVFNIADIYGSCDLYSALFKILVFLSAQLLTVTFLTVSASVVDRFLALKIHLRYRELVTVRMVSFCLLFIWITSTTLALWILIDFANAKLGAMTLSIVVSFTTATCYAKIFRVVRHHQNQIASQFPVPQGDIQTSVPNIVRYRKSLRSLLYIAGLFFLSNIFWLFWFICKLSLGFENNQYESKLATRIFLSLSYLNSCLNPFLYCWRIGEIRQAMTEQFKKMCTC